MMEVEQPYVEEQGEAVEEMEVRTVDSMASFASTLSYYNIIA
jgi:hypothetical protein